MKKIIFISVLGILALVLIFSRVRYFSYSRDISPENTLESFLKKDSELRSFIEKQYKNILEDLQKRKSIAAKNATTSPENLKNLAELEITLKKEFEKKNSELLDPEIKNILNKAPQEWKRDVMSAKNIIQFRSQTPCRICLNEKECENPITIFSKRILEFYPREKKDEVLSRIQKENLSLPQGLCQRQAYSETEKFFIVDGCAGDFQCPDIQPLDEILAELK